jgi:hypothetical protein
MIIETKYNVGDKVFFLQENAIHRGYIRQVTVNVTCSEGCVNQNEYYNIDCYDRAIFNTYKNVAKSLIYKSKEELLKSL